jgi:hypothetical protein
MKWRSEKIAGYVLLILGVVVIFFSIYEMFVVFTGGSPPPKLFNFSDISVPGTNNQNVMLISGQEVSKFADLFCWLILMFFVMWGGGKVASLGVNLIREIRVEIKEPLRKVEEETGKTEEKKGS